MREDGLIGAELHTALMLEIGVRRAECEERPRLDIAVRRSDMVRQFPIFADLEEAELNRLGKALRTRYVNAGDVVIRKDTPAKSVFFIASGAVELETAGQTWRLGRGEMFGQMALLLKRPRRVEVRALAPSTLISLDEQRFRRVLDRSATLRNAVRRSAEKRGIAPEIIAELGRHEG